MLGDYLHGEVVFLYLYVGAVAHGLHQPALYLGPGVVGVVQYAELRVAALAVQVVVAVGLLVEVYAPADQFLYLRRRVSHHLLYGAAVADVVAGYHRVLYVLIEVVDFQVGHRGHAALGERGVGLLEQGLAYHAHLALVSPCYLQGVTHTGHSCADNQKIVLENHVACMFIWLQMYKK